MRDPSIHIRLSDFTKVIESIGIKEPHEVALAIFERSVPFNINHRYQLNIENKKMLDAINKVIKAANTSKITVQHFNRLLSAERRKAGHKFFKEIKQTDSTYIQLQEVANLAFEFAGNCGFESVEEGCRIYLQLGLDKMKRSNQYNLGKFKYYDQQIYKEYESWDMITNDPDAEATKEYYQAYVNLLAEYAGIEREDLDRVENYVCFILCRLDAERLGADAEDFVRAQFEELGKMFDSVPSPIQLFGDNASKRFYQYSGKAKPKDDDSVILIDYSKPKSEFEEKYAAKLKERLNEEK